MEFTEADKQRLVESVARRLESQTEIKDEEIQSCATEVLEQMLNSEFMTVKEKRELVSYVFNNIRKLGVLQPILDDPSVTEVMINGPDCIFVEQSGRLYRRPERFDSNKQLEDIIQKIVANVNRTVDSLHPICDARLLDGSRVNIVLPPIALNGATVTIRRFPEKVISFEDLIAWGAITTEAAEFLKSCVQAKCNIFVSGGTGSGKTTFLNALSNFIPEDERIITIEDSAELQIQRVQNLVRLETRQANTEGKGEVTMRELIKSSLRMRPERIVVGEVRGAEALDMLQAMNTGHDGSLSTGHANSPVDMLSRLETMVLTGANFPIEAIRQQIGSAIDLIVHLGRLSDKSRKVLDIVEMVGYQDGKYEINPLFHFEREQEELVNGNVVGSFKPTGNSMVHTEKFVMNGIKLKLPTK
ncbi:MAG: CpaF family protein [Lachnospiraceae bacterium]|nr:CpaF family protein [Lachnospiraceae bacterium]